MVHLFSNRSLFPFVFKQEFLTVKSWVISYVDPKLHMHAHACTNACTNACTCMPICTKPIVRYAQVENAHHAYIYKITETSTYPVTQLSGLEKHLPWKLFFFSTWCLAFSLNAVFQSSSLYLPASLFPCISWQNKYNLCINRSRFETWLGLLCPRGVLPDKLGGDVRLAYQNP